MIFTKIKKGNLIFFYVIIIFIILNPGYTNFKEFTGLTGKSAENLHKRNNFLLFSIYENSKDDKKYLAVLMNFINITQSKPVVVTKPPKKIRMIFPDNSIGEIDSSDLLTALSLGAKLIPEKSTK